jgi:hypothetical protein
VTNLICLEAFREATQELEEAELRSRQAAHNLASIRAKLEQALDHAYREQSFGPLDPLFSKEEAALAQYEQAASKLNEPEISSKIEGEGSGLGAVPTTRGGLLLSSQMFMDRRSFHPDDILGYVNGFQIRNV